MFDAYPFIRPLLFALPPEFAHALSLRALNTAHRYGLLPASELHSNPINIMGIDFPNRIGVAAGLDKNGVCVDALIALGFGFVEVGTVTPRAQYGNAKPRLYRLVKDRAIVNRMGFPNDGAATIAQRLKQRRGIVGFNIGKNADTPFDGATADYILGLQMVYSVADYVVANISSPNTIGLRQLQTRERLLPLLDAMLTTRIALQAHTGRYVPLLIKLTVDLGEEELVETSRAAMTAGIDGIVVSNTTVSREGLLSRNKKVDGGLSGPPLLPRSLQAVRCVRAAIGSSATIIGVGGVTSGNDARAMRAAGADLVQIYTALIYRGPKVIGEMVKATCD